MKKGESSYNQLRDEHLSAVFEIEKKDKEIAELKSRIDQLEHAAKKAKAVLDV